ncbi:hypothetical protein Vretimale_18879 [Volvox reticuliferus]|uniref:Chlorophyllase n=1 Tax=Volvox reticuliferus TaxID=1737510 RepID=A0A8J4LZR5_9CHLO|nr:hypothetical protein Vretifemale_18904 [Volvox reticuliferus]GIM16205.1 hypothetical protein Vretimale_18879 [Volvox reticuliferus]
MKTSNMFSLCRSHLQSAAFLLLCTALAAPAVFAQDFWEPGKHAVEVLNSCTTPLPNNWPVNVTYPRGESGPFPLIAMFNGMECQASWYTDIINHVASWGYVIVQYTTDFGFPLNPFGGGEREEVQYLAPLLRWLEKEPKLAGKIDFANKAVMGHSRGGKLAALHYANRTNNFKTAVLIDPVDCSSFAMGPSHPSAIAALAGKPANCGILPLPPYGHGNLPAAIIGAGIVWMCNPGGSNAEAFNKAVSVQSLYVTVKGAGHMTFTKPPEESSFWSIINRSCWGGTIASEVAISEARTMAVAWLESKFRPSQETTNRLARYKQHLSDLTGEGVLTFNWPEGGALPGSSLPEAPAGAAAGRREEL